SGLGADSVRQIDVNRNYQMDPEFLSSRIREDREGGFAPFMVVGTAGTTNAGIVDPLPELADVAEREKLWFHVDAAWGGAAALEPRLRRVLAGVERADSITFDAHKWLAAPMGAGIYLTRHQDILYETCRVSTDYMPRDADELDVIDPYTHSMQWSRRFIGLKVFMTLAAAGWRGCAAAIRRQAEMGELLRRELEKSNWKIVNRTELPVVCFVDQEHPEGDDASFLESIARAVVSSGKAWISPTRLDEETPVLRACITNVRTRPEDVSALVRILNEAREKKRF
ncbi:MAG: pyridoxal-dependent decarboxylase, partial [Desulfobacterales bacterium]|nr:pyridoxal-dependent decarboxylase [Desulfobacterales bacterium]